MYNADLELHNSSKNWFFEIKQVMNGIGLSDQFESKSVINLSKVDMHLNVFYASKWKEDVQHELIECSKLNLKQRSISNSIRSIMRQLRSGVLPLIIETSRSIGEALNQRMRRFCNTDAVEDEKIFLFE